MTQSEQQGSSSALTRLLAMIANDNHSLALTRLSDNLQFTSRFSRPLANCLLSAGAAHLTLVV